MSVTISGNALACFSSFSSDFVFYVWNELGFKCSNVFYIETFKSIVNVAGDQIWDPAIRKTTREQQSLATTKLRFDFTLVSVLTWDWVWNIRIRASRASFIQELSYRWSGIYIFVFYAFSDDSPIVERVMTMTSKRIQVVVVTANSESCGILEFVKWSPVITQSLTWIYGLHVLSLLLSCLVNLYDEMQAVPTRFLTDDRMAIIIPVFFFNQSLIHNSMTLQESFSLSNPISTLSIEESISSHHLWMIFMRVFSMVHVLSVNPVYSHMYRFIIISY